MGAIIKILGAFFKISTKGESVDLCFDCKWPN